MRNLSKKVSQAVVAEIVAAFGAVSAAKHLGVMAARVLGLIDGPIALPFSSLTRMEQATGKTWRTWVLQAAERAGASDQVLQPTTRLVQALNRAEASGRKSPKFRKPYSSRVMMVKLP